MPQIDTDFFSCEFCVPCAKGQQISADPSYPRNHQQLTVELFAAIGHEF